MKKLVFIGINFCLLLLSACSNNTDETAKVITNTLVNTDEPKETIVNGSDLEKILLKFTNEDKFPFVIKSENIEDLSKDEELSGADVKLLTFKMNKKEPNSDGFLKLLDFYNIDSIKLHNQYEKYKESLRSGDVQESMCFAISRIKITDEASVLFWMNDYSTLDAFPLSGKIIYATTINNTNIGETIVFAENSGGGDTPYYITTKIKGTIKADGSIIIDKIEQFESKDEIEIKESIFNLTLKNGLYTYTKEVTKEPRIYEKVTK